LSPRSSKLNTFPDLSIHVQITIHCNNIIKNLPYQKENDTKLSSKWYHCTSTHILLLILIIMNLPLQNKINK
jgi:hypothetical protein